MGYRKDLQELDALKIERESLEIQIRKEREEHEKEIFLKQSEIEANRMLLEILEDEKKGLQDEIKYIQNLKGDEEENVYQEFVYALTDLADNVFHLTAIADFLAKVLDGIANKWNKFYKFVTKKKGE